MIDSCSNCKYLEKIKHNHFGIGKAENIKFVAKNSFGVFCQRCFFILNKAIMEQIVFIENQIKYLEKQIPIYSLKLIK